MAAKVFIDGDAGTTGLEIRNRLIDRRDIDLLRLPEDRRKDPAARAEALNACDLAILCLPDPAAREAVAMIESPAVKVIDASTAHRTADGWVYGFAEVAEGQRERIAHAQRVSNPGCYSTGAIALLAPLVAAGLIPADWPITINAISGYSGGGKSLIKRFEADGDDTPFYLYGLTLTHKHVPEIQTTVGLAQPPMVVPSVGRYRQGMLVSVPLILDALPGRPSSADIRAALEARYAGQTFVSVAPAASAGELDPQALNHTNRMALHLFANDDRGQMLLVAQLDNLGKGASGAAVQNMNLMLGLDEAEGLVSHPAQAAQ
jgi:N-acetyl-gamma-glutamyl-phosphate reductase